jgi:hypothetical protein
LGNRPERKIICPKLDHSFVVTLKAKKLSTITQEQKTNMNTQSQNGYMLLYRTDEWYNRLSHEELRKLMDQNKAWIEKLTAQGRAKPGRALERRGAIVSGKNGRFVTDGPFAESKEAIGGYLMLDVESIDEAIAIAQSSPGLAYGGSIEVRPVAEECPLEVRALELAREEQLATV